MTLLLKKKSPAPHNYYMTFINSTLIFINYKGKGITVNKSFYIGGSKSKINRT